MMITSFDYLLDTRISPAHQNSLYPSSRQILSSLRQTIYLFQSKNKSIYNQYKSNLKSAFEKKIDTYKMQSFMIRAEEKEKAQNQRIIKEKALSESKKKRVKHQRLQRLSSRLYVSQTLQQKAEKARSCILRERQDINKIICEKEEKLYIQNQQKRIQINRDKVEGRLRRQQRMNVCQMKQRESYAIQMKKQLEQIIQKQQILQKLSDQLRQLEEEKQERQGKNEFACSISEKKTIEQNSSYFGY